MNTLFMDCLEHNFEIGGAGVIIFQILVYTMVVFYDEPGPWKTHECEKSVLWFIVKV